MARVKRGVTSHAKHKKVLDQDRRKRHAGIGLSLLVKVLVDRDGEFHIRLRAERFLDHRRDTASSIQLARTR